MISDITIWTAAALGALSHNAFFIRGEHYLQAPTIFRLVLLMYAVLFFSSWMTGLREVSRDAFLAFGLFAGSLIISMTLYRTIFHLFALSMVHSPIVYPNYGMYSCCGMRQPIYPLTLYMRNMEILYELVCFWSTAFHIIPVHYFCRPFRVDCVPS